MKRSCARISPPVRCGRETVTIPLGINDGCQRRAEGGGIVREDLITRWADLLVDYCLAVAPGETVMIGAEWEARPLVEACYRAVVLRGGNPLVRLELPGLTEFFLRNA